MKICLAGPYPSGTRDTFAQVLPADRFELVQAETQEAFESVTDADVVVLRVLKMPKESFSKFSQLKVVLRWGAGFDSVDIEEAGARGIAVCNAPGANAYAVAELAVGLMIDIGRNVFGYYSNVKKDNWDRNAFRTAVSLNKKMVGVVGGGNIGRQVARRVQAFGATVQYYDAFRLPPEVENAFGMRYVELEYLLKTSDVVTLHVPLLDSTYHIVGREQLAMMKHGALLVNTARGGLVDDAALVEMLASGQIGGAGLDCVENEDSDATRALRQRDDVIITPHIGGTTSDLGSAMIPMLAENILALAEGRPLAHIVNQQFLTL